MELKLWKSFIQSSFIPTENEQRQSSFYRLLSILYTCASSHQYILRNMFYFQIICDLRHSAYFLSALIECCTQCFDYNREFHLQIIYFLSKSLDFQRLFLFDRGSWEVSLRPFHITTRSMVACINSRVSNRHCRYKKSETELLSLTNEFMTLLTSVWIFPEPIVWFVTTNL